MKPTPETIEAVLWSDAAQDFTTHTYAETTQQEDGFEFVFECSITKQRRVWGNRRLPEVN